ncbi:alcohol dehydrogenase class IV [Desulfohalotomaculum tongense]|uniref:iron-containing alcohol dehydrogenase family protein n=1 Tax=Desulforadius tongensis TaxID=1216062 RepID=UPI001956BAE6|nr:iron-containing alcohol dehydrogenase family protein [Desulforadius tongensis]MBM7854053.1 alcohol dehydrogenase class IV [Desulforadius tongensis]
MQFNFRCPTRIFFDEQCVQKYSSQLSALGRKALVVTGRTSSKRNGSLRDMIAAFSQEGIQYNVFDEVEENPSLKTVYRAANMARKLEAEFIVGIGGGSPMDAAKAVAVLATNNISEQDLMDKKWTADPLPIVAVPTTAGTGSEVTPYSILTVDWAETKKSIAGEKLFPAVAFMDARYTRNLPWNITINTAVDALSHSVEGFVNNRATVFSDLLALESISIIGRLLKTMTEDDITLSQREELLYASMLGGIVIAQTATGVIHALGYPLTYFKGLPHGLANGVVMKASLEFLAQSSPDRVEQVVKSMGCKDLEEFGNLLKKVLSPVDIKLTTREQDLYVAKTLQAKNIANCPKKPEEKDIYEILKNSSLV